MYTKIVKRGGSEETLHDVFVATLYEHATENTRGAVSHPIGSDEIYIRSTHPSWGTIPFSGREDLGLLRDALIEICKMENID
jgi:hypothetical protein